MGGRRAQVRYRLPCSALQGHRPEQQQQQQRSIEQRLSASEFLDLVAALIPPPRKHWHRYFGVLAPNSPWRWWWRRLAGSWGRGLRHPGQRQCAQILRHAGRTPGTIFVGTVAGAHLRGVSTQVQRVRRAGAPGWVHHRAGDGAADTGTCR